MKNFKKSYSLFITIILIGIFSFISLDFFRIKSLRISNLKNQALYIQAKNHMQFLKKISSSYEFDKKFEIQNSDFEIYAIKKHDKIHYFVNSKENLINLYENSVLE